MSDNLNKIKVVWICHFSNPEVQKRLPLVKPSPQFAPWITLLIEEFKKIENIDLYVISPFEWLKRDTTFNMDGVQYAFIRTGIPIIHRHWPAIFKLDYLTHFLYNRRKIARIVSDIHPDIINLHGIENPYYGYFIFDLKKYPILITIQGLFSLSGSVSKSFQDRMRLKTEQKIIREFGNYGIRVKFLADYLKSKNPEVNLYWYKYPFIRNTNLSLNHTHPKFDIVFFARISKDKGIEDLITAVEIVKKSKGSVSVKIIGNGNAQYIEYLRKRVSNLHLEKNIEFLGFLATQEELHEVVSNAKICVLPTYNDILPGTIIESLFLKIPVIAYAANGVVDLNFESENIRLVETGNITELAKQINILLEDELARETLSSRAYKYAIRNFDNKVEAGKMIRAYLKVISDFKNNSQ